LPVGRQIVAYSIVAVFFLPFAFAGSNLKLEKWRKLCKSFSWVKRLHDDYTHTGFKGYGVKTRAGKGHEFGLKFSSNEKKALIEFLKTL
jgi:hypothetical protein